MNINFDVNETTINIEPNDDSTLRLEVGVDDEPSFDINRAFPIDVKITETSGIDIDIDFGFGKLPYYNGTYVVTPRTIGQYLPTAQKSMRANVTVKPIPYTEISNLYGQTVAIGQE